ncbi:MAG TPA: HAD family hydrolase [Ruminococcus sp.]|nr:HAD family hydrolase [Ruminococcus sp.]
MQFSDIKAVVFDLDGTLLNTLDDLMNGLNAALSENGMPERSRTDVRRFVGNGLAKLVERAIPDGRANPLYEKTLADTRRFYAQKCRENTKPYDGIAELLAALQQKGLRLAVVSNKPDAQVKKLCGEFFPGRISAAIGQRDGVPLKPAADPVLEALRLLDTSPADAVYVGDSDVDILTAKNAGIPCISVLWGFRDRPLLESAGGKLFAASPAEMIRFF